MILQCNECGAKFEEGDAIPSVECPRCHNGFIEMFEVELEAE